MGTKM